MCSAMDVLRTPEHCFENLSGFDTAPHYVDDLPGYEGLRLHYVDEGPRDAKEVWLCLHGEPTWSYLYRKFIPLLTGRGIRVVAPDLFGFGRSDKPADRGVHTFTFHRRALLEFLDRMQLPPVTLVCQDWGGILGLTLPMELPEQFRKLVVMNTALPAGQPPGPGFLAWRAYVEAFPDLDVARLMKRACPELDERECDAYNAPFPDVKFKTGVQRMPQIVPIEESMDGAKLTAHAKQWWASTWSGESQMVIGAQDPVLGPEIMHDLHNHINACPKPLLLPNAGHFVPESASEFLPQILDRFDV